MKSPALAAALVAACALPALAATPAFDDASDPVYDDGWDPADDGGSGWAAGWNGLGAPGSYSLATSTANGNGDDDFDGDIDTGGRAWAVTTSMASVPVNLVRSFDGVLEVGERVTVEIDHDPVPDPGQVGIRLTSTLGEQRFALIWFGNQQDYFALGDGFQAMNVPHTDEGLRIEFRLTGADTFSVDLTPIGGSTTTVDGTLAAGTAIKNLILNASSSGVPETFYFNSIAVPEPRPGLAAVGALLALSLLGGGRRRRDRAVSSTRAL